MPVFERETYLPFARHDVFSWYCRPGALTRLQPPFAGSVVQEPPEGPVDGAESVITLNPPGLMGNSAKAGIDLLGTLLPMSPQAAVTWRSRHEDYEHDRGFSDVMVAGPLKSWRHQRRFEDSGEGTLLKERITYELPVLKRLPQAARQMTQQRLEKELERIFTFREHQTIQDLAFHQSHGSLATQQRHERSDTQAWLEPHEDSTHARINVVAVSGVTGMIGTQVCALLGGAGIEVRRLVRPESTAGSAERGDIERGDNERRDIEPSDDTAIGWDPEAGTIDAEALAEVDAVINLAGEPLAAKFTPEHKQRIQRSRIRGTRLLAETLVRLQQADDRGRALISGSAIGWYGATGADRTHTRTPLREEDPADTDFLASVCQQWEKEADAAAREGVRVVTVRTGIVQSPSGGALARQLPLFAAGLGGPLGRRQVLSWISLDDIASLIVHLTLDSRAHGPVNAVAPHPVNGADYARTLGAVLRRPAVLPVPSLAPKLLLGKECTREMVLADQDVSADKALSLGFGYRHPSLEQALRHVLGR